VDYLRYHLNYWGQQDTSVIEMPQWIACGDPDAANPVDMRNWPTYDVDLLIQKWKLADKPCYAGVDASWTTDLTSLVLVFPTDNGDPWTILPFFWMAEGRIKERERKDKVPYGEWTKRGFIEAVPGMSIHMDVIKKKIAWAAGMFELREMCYDPWGFREVADKIAEEGIAAAVEVRQNYALLSEPTKRLLAMYTDRQIRHGNHPVLNWNAKCLSLQGDRKDNVQPSKPERTKNSKRIDGISATVTAMARAIMLESNVINYTGLQSV
jgi:phage terminase large subunit-like protein